MLAGQVIEGGCVSLTVTVNEQVAVLPDASVAAQVTVVTPLLNAEPEAGLQLIVAPGQLSLAVAVNMTTAVHTPESVVVVILPGQTAVGASLSLTVTVNMQVDVLPDASVAVQVTVVVPLANAEPDAGVHDVVTPKQLSIAVGVNVTTAVH
jgi:hypothetical protein